MAIFRVCKEDPLLLSIRQNYHAIPLKNPEFRIKPLTIFSWHKKSKQTDFKGKLKPLLQNGDRFKAEIYESPMGQIARKRTRRVSTSLGLELLGGFLSGLGMDLSPFSGALDKVKQVSFSFDNLKRYYVDKNELGGILGNYQFNPTHLSLSSFTASDSPFEMMLIDSVITSSRFNIHSEKTKETNFKLKPELANVIANGKIKWKVKIEDQKDIGFEGDQPITFAVTGMPLKVDWLSGSIIGFEEPSIDIASLGEDETPWRDGELLVWD